MRGAASVELARRATSATVANELLAQHETNLQRWGEQSHPLVHRDPSGSWSLTSYGIWLPVSALQARCDDRHRRGCGAWADILVEELAEAFDAAARGDVDGARGELVQLGAAVVAAIESIDREGR